MVNKEKPMNENTLNLVSAIINKDATDIETYFNAAMAEKISDRLEDMRSDVAQTMFAEPEETFVEEDFEWISEEEYLQLTEEEQEECLTEEQLDELMGKGSIGTVKKIHHDAAYNSGRQTDRTSFHGDQAARAHHIASKIDIRAKYGKDSQHYHEYGAGSKRAKASYARLSPAAKKKVTQTLGKEYTGKDKAPGILTRGKTTIKNPSTKAQNYDSAVHRTNVRTKEFNAKALPDDEKIIKGGRD